MKIVIFGSKKCKFCSDQIGFISNAFDPGDWMYVDATQSKDMLKIAQETNVKNLPATVIFDDEWNAKSIQEGTVSCDKIFCEIYGKKAIPMGPKTSELFIKKVTTSCVLSHPREVEIGKNIDIVNYKNNIIANAKVLSNKMISPKAMGSICHPSILEEYLLMGGRNDWAQLIVFGV